MLRIEIERTPGAAVVEQASSRHAVETCAPTRWPPSSPLRLRFAPSPTGALHIGGARTALYNWLAARQSGGSLVLRIEDTDRERSTEENVEQILDALRWLELDWDEGPVSEARAPSSHADGAAAAAGGGAAYRDSANAKDVEAWKAEHGAGRGYRGEPSDEPGAAVRLRVPDEGETVVEDLIRGPVSFPNRSYDDFVIARGDGSVLYHFAVAVDDAEMGITDVVRGDDHLSDTPKQLLVLASLGYEPPRYAHLPLFSRPMAASSPSGTAPPRCRICASPAICRRRCGTTSPCSAGGPTTTPP